MAKRESIESPGLAHGAPIPMGSKIGNMVYSSGISGRNVETGELCFRPVVERTVRPPTRIMNIRLADHELPIRATKGHPIWVNGKGWRMAKKLEVGELLQSMHGPAEVVAVEEEPTPREAFNLVVAGTGTYFVGQEALLVHDNTYRAPTRCVVPGLKGL